MCGHKKEKIEVPLNFPTRYKSFRKRNTTLHNKKVFVGIISQRDAIVIYVRCLNRMELI